MQQQQGLVGAASKPNSYVMPQTQQLNGAAAKKKQKQPRRRSNAAGTRYLSSLGVLTKKFVDLLQKAENGCCDLNTAASKLGVQKRRIYDITNVLEGINLIEKRPKGNILWRGSGELDPQAEAEMERIKVEITNLLDQEQVLELDLHHMISVVKKQMADKSYMKQAFITLNDVKRMKCFDDATVMAIKAPMGTTLEVPDPDSFEGENGRRRYNIYLKSLYGPIDVFLVSSNHDNEEAAAAATPPPSPSPAKPTPNKRRRRDNSTSGRTVGAAHATGAPRPSPFKWSQCDQSFGMTPGKLGLTPSKDISAMDAISKFVMASPSRTPGKLGLTPTLTGALPPQSPGFLPRAWQSMESNGGIQVSPRDKSPSKDILKDFYKRKVCVPVV